MMFKRGSFSTYAILFVLIFLGVNSVFAQTVPQEVQDSLGCDPTVPFFTLDLTGDPAASDTIIGQDREDYCCTASGSDNCYVIELVLDPGSSGISISPTGAPASNVSMWVND